MMGMLFVQPCPILVDSTDQTFPHFPIFYSFFQFFFALVWVSFDGISLPFFLVVSFPFTADRSKHTMAFSSEFDHWWPKHMLWIYSQISSSQEVSSPCFITGLGSFPPTSSQLLSQPLFWVSYLPNWPRESMGLIPNCWITGSPPHTHTQNTHFPKLFPISSLDSLSKPQLSLHFAHFKDT